MIHSQHRAGISLAIVAVLLVIIGSAVSVMMMRKDREAVWNPMTGSHSDLSTVKQALVAYQQAYHRLPCVAPRNALATDAAFGMEITDCATGVAATGGTVRLNLGGGRYLRIGAVPHRTLGLSETGAEDQWKNRLLYAVTESLTDVYQFTNGAGAITVEDATSMLAGDAAFVVLSHGKDAKGAYGAKSASVGKLCASVAGLDQKNCDDADAIFADIPVAQEAGPAHFDDLVVWEKVDVYAQSINRPCIAATLGAATWPTGCMNTTWTNMPNGGTQDIDNTNIATHAGETTLGCNNGALTYAGTSCNRHCLASGQSWQSDCTGNVPFTEHGTTSASVTNTAPSFTGSATFNCVDGTLSVNSSNCSAAAPSGDQCFDAGMGSGCLVTGPAHGTGCIGTDIGGGTCCSGCTPPVGCDGAGGCFDNCECRPNGSLSNFVGWPNCRMHRCDNGSWVDLLGMDHACTMCP